MQRSTLVLVFAAVVFACGIWILPLQEPDEGRYGEISLAMAAPHGDLVTPHLNGIRYFEKPPLYFWICALFLKIFGKVEWAVRLPSVLSALAAVWLTMRLARTAFGEKTAWMSGVVLTTAPLVALFAHICIVDMLLFALLTAALLSLYHALLDAVDDRPPLVPLLGAYAFSALATLTKGPIGIVIPGVTAFLFLVVTGRWRLMLRLIRIEGFALFAAIAAPWFVEMSLRNPGYLYDFFVGENLNRFTSGIEFRRAPAWAYLPALLVTFAPWSLWLWPVIRRVVAAAKARLDRSAAPHLFFASAFLAPLLFLSLAQSKLAYYLLPLYPALAILLAAVFARESDEGSVPAERRNRILFGVVAAIGVLFFAVGTALAMMPPDKLIERLSRGAKGIDPEYLAVRAGSILALLVPLAIIGAFIAAGAIVAIVVSRRRGALAGIVALALTMGGWEAAIPLVVARGERLISERAVAVALERVTRPDDVLFFFHEYYRSIPFYIGRPVMMWDAWPREFGHTLPPAELAGHGIQRDVEKLRALLGSKRRVVVIVQDSAALNRLEHLSPVPLYRLAHVAPRWIVATKR